VNHPPTPGGEPDTAGALDFRELLGRLARHARRHLLAALLGGVAALGLTFVIPSWYRAVAVILPPEETDQIGVNGGLGRFLSHMPTIAGVTSQYTAADIYRAILLSRTVNTAVARQYDLPGVYHEKSMEKTLRKFGKNTKVDLRPDGTIAVEVLDRSAARSADLANGLVRELDRFNVERRNFQAKRTRIFLERRVAETDSLSRHYEGLLRDYQEEKRVVVPMDDAANASPAADLIARQMTLQVQLQVLRSYLKEDNERIIQVRTELEQLGRRIAALPSLQTHLARLLRDVRLYQQAYIMLSAQLEEARLREAQDTPTVTLLDDAIPPERRAKPIRRLWALGGAILAGVVSVLWAEWPRRRVPEPPV
jgi:uncharacterized protein involved in exopolysaccharide biosynthesis